MFRCTLATILISFISANALGQTTMQPPSAKKIAKKLETHGHQRVDNYYWLNDRSNQQVIDYLNEENEYTTSVLSDVKSLETELFDEIVARIKQDDESVPYTFRGYVYYSRFNKGEQYPIFCRKKDAPDAAEEIMLNVNELAVDKPFCRVSAVEVSPNDELLAYAVDFVGRRQYTIQFKSLKTGEVLEDSIPQASGDIEWCNDNKTVFYTRNDPQTLRTYQVKRHILGTPATDDPVVFEETDEEFYCGIYKSRSRELIFIESEQTLSTEVRYLAADDPMGEFRVFLPRSKKHEYSVDHYDGLFYIRSNENAENFQLFKAQQASPSRENWEEVLPHRADTFFVDVDVFEDFLVISERTNALRQLRIMSHDGKIDYYLPFEEAAYVAYSRATPDAKTPWLRFYYTSLTTPGTTYEFNLQTKDKKLLKQEPVLGDFSSDNYKTERVWAEARDGTKIPVSIVYHKDTDIDGTAPCLEYAYGSYGSSMDPSFRSNLLSLIDRGFVYAIAHIRGGQEMGRQWYENGKLLKKKNTFTDFIDVGKFLIEKKYAARERLYARGGSAGGLLMGAVMNMAPELYHGIIADVPFVDVVTTMLDDSIPLTTFEYDEWGNPNDKQYYDYMLSYSPYDNVRDVEYPNVLVTTGLHDSQVQYWEPAKWVAKLRENWKGDKILLLKTNMEAGHGGASGRFDRYKEVATRYAFLLKLQSQENKSAKVD